MLEEYEGAIVEIIFHNSENGYTVAIFETDLEAFTVVGTLPSVRVGQSLKIRGQFREHPTYGEQFQISEWEETLPSSKEGIREFLASGVMKGVGKKTARLIVSKFGEDTLRVIEEEPERLTEINGIGPKTADRIAESYRAHREFAGITLYLQSYGIGPGYALKLYQVYGADTVAAVEENPYRLVDEVFGIGFKKADAIARKIGIAEDDPFRIASGIRFTLGYFAAEGSTYLPKEILCERAAGIMDLTIEQVADVLPEMAFDGTIHMETMEDRVN
ncbi:MAG: ATP-dependent RecD-like DNA helicase, partial [Firmicutes bacterium]|nr:ATP-dependent RecD-like DNA helicase [Bacillota bacterium]